MKLTKEKLKSIFEGLRDYLYNELDDALAYYGDYDEKVFNEAFNEAFDDAVAQVISDAEYNGDFEEE